MISKTTATAMGTGNFDYANPETVKCDDIYLTEKSIGPLIQSGEAYNAVQSVLIDTPRNISIHLTSNVPNASEYEPHGSYECVQPTAVCNESVDSILTPLVKQGNSVQNQNERADEKAVCSLNCVQTDCEHVLERNKALLHLQHCTTNFFQCSSCEPRSNTQNLYLEESSSKNPYEKKKNACEELGGYDCNDTFASKKKGPSRKNAKQKKEMSTSYESIANESTVLHHLMNTVTCRLNESNPSKTIDSNVEEDTQNHRDVKCVTCLENSTNEEKKSYIKHYETSAIEGVTINDVVGKSRETKQDPCIQGIRVEDVSVIMSGEKNRRRKTAENVFNSGNVIRKVAAADGCFVDEKCCHPMMTRHRKMSKGNCMNNSSNDVRYNEATEQLGNNYNNNNNNNNNNNINNDNNNINNNNNNNINNSNNNINNINNNNINNKNVNSKSINNNNMTQNKEFFCQTYKYWNAKDQKETINLDDFVGFNVEPLKYLPKSTLNDSLIDIQTETNSNNDITETTTAATNYNKDMWVSNVSKSRNKHKDTYMLDADLQLEGNIKNTMCEELPSKQTFPTIQGFICANNGADEKNVQHELVLDDMELTKRNFTPNKSIYYNEENCTGYTEEKTDDTSKQSDSTFNTWNPISNISVEVNRIAYHEKKKKSTKGKGGNGGGEGEGDANDATEENQKTHYTKSFHETYNNACPMNGSDTTSKSNHLKLSKSSGLKKKEDDAVDNDDTTNSMLKKKKLSGKCFNLSTKKKMEKSDLPVETGNNVSDRYPNILHENHYYYNASDNYDREDISEEEKQILNLMKINNSTFYKKRMSARDLIYGELPENSKENEDNNPTPNSVVDDKKIHAKRNTSLGVSLGLNVNTNMNMNVRTNVNTNVNMNMDVDEKGTGKEEEQDRTFETKEVLDLMSITKSTVSVKKETELANLEQLTISESTKRNAVQTKRDNVVGVKRNDAFIEQRSTTSLTPKQKIKRMWHKLKRHTTHKEFHIPQDHAKEKDLVSKKSGTTDECVDKNNDRECENYKNKNTGVDSISCGVTAAESDVFTFNKMESIYKGVIDKKERGEVKQMQHKQFIENEPKQPCIFNWKLARKVLAQMFQNANDYSYEGVKFPDWKLTSIPTLGFSKSSNRVQLMFKASVPIRHTHDAPGAKGGIRAFSTEDMSSKKEVKFFVKKIPVYIWVEQFNLMDKYDGEYVTDGENFVMEAAALAFLNQYHPGITPKLYKILYEPEGHEYINEKLQSPIIYENLSVLNDVLSKRLKANINGHIIIISEFFNEDILDYIDRKQRKHNMKISNQEKLFILHHCLNLLIKLHNAGLSHLDLTPENILISENYELRLCDLAKSTPLYSYNLRHLKVNGNTNTLYPFESCEPTIAKGSYMPPECWKIYWRYDTMKIRNPLKELKRVVDQERRKLFYFNVANADKFMLGVFFFWIWTNGNIWKYSDPLQDEDFFYFVKCKMDFDKFELTKRWPTHLKHIVRELLHPDSRSKLNLNDLSEHPLWSHKF